MRPYRGKTKEGKWVYGWYIFSTIDEIIQNGLRYEVIPETVGQFVCKDKNGKGVFEGDNATGIVWLSAPPFRVEGIVTKWKAAYAIKTKSTIYEINDLRDIELIEETE